MSGHSTEEKIKILYEDSLRDIRNLTIKIEKVAQAITAASDQMANGKSLLRAENEQLLLGAVSEIKTATIKICEKPFSDSTTQFQSINNDRASISTIKNVLGGVIAFGAGTYLGANETPMLQVSLGLVLGLMIGLIVAVLIIIRMEQQELSMASKRDREQRLKEWVNSREEMQAEIFKTLEGRTKQK
jgi:hypothetical protein